MASCVEEYSVEKISNIHIGNAGVYYAAAELTNNGFNATITAGNTKAIDIFCSDDTGKNIFAIQVKTNNNKNKSWLLSKSSENIIDNKIFYIFINLKKMQRPDFHIVPSAVVAKYIRERHSKYLKKPGRYGRKHKDTSMRKYSDIDSSYLEKWELLKNEP